MQGESILSGVHPELQRRMRAAIAATEARGVPIIVRSGFRTYATQVNLWNNRLTNRYPVAQPGYSPHEWGVAVDARPISETAANWNVLWQEASRQGLTLGHNFNNRDDVHFELPGFAHGSLQQPGLAQYGIYARPGGAPAPPLPSAPGFPQFSLPAAPASNAMDLSSYGIGNDTLTVIVAGIVILVVMSWVTG